MNKLLQRMYVLFNTSRAADFLGPLLLRLYLVPIFWMAGSNKVEGFDDIVSWFGNEDWGLGLPFPLLMAVLATAAEVVGAVCLLLGLAVRLMAVPLMFTMLVAMTTVHAEYGWQAIADPGAPFANERVEQSVAKKEAINAILQEHGDYNWLTSSGKVVILNNGIEFGATYFVMLLALFFTGAGRWFSLDHWIKKCFLPEKIT